MFKFVWWYDDCAIAHDPVGLRNTKPNLIGANSA
jgi:hypothetical protein